MLACSTARAVCRYDVTQKLYTVVYEDNDTEDILAVDLSDIVVPSASPTPPTSVPCPGEASADSVDMATQNSIAAESTADSADDAANGVGVEKKEEVLREQGRSEEKKEQGSIGDKDAHSRRGRGADAAAEVKPKGDKNRRFSGKLGPPRRVLDEEQRPARGSGGAMVTGVRVDGLPQDGEAGEREGKADEAPQTAGEKKPVAYSAGHTDVVLTHTLRSPRPFADRFVAPFRCLRAAVHARSALEHSLPHAVWRAAGLRQSALRTRPRRQRPHLWRGCKGRPRRRWRRLGHAWKTSTREWQRQNSGPR